MLNLNYSRYDIVALQLLELGKSKPTAADLEEYDQDLFDANEKILLEEMTTAGIEIRKDTKSTVLLFSRILGGSRRNRIRNACAYFNATTGL